MIIHEIEQRTEEWHRLRLGIPTASNFAKIFTGTGKNSSQALAYMEKLIGEWITGEVEESFSNRHTLRGEEMESQALSAYEFLTEFNVKPVGFVTDDHCLVGCSPDALVGDQGGLEIKCVIASQMVKAILRGDVPIEHRPQIQGCMWITGRKWWDFEYYNPRMKPFVCRVLRDTSYITSLAAAVNAFNRELHKKKHHLTQIGWSPNEDKSDQD